MIAHLQGGEYNGKRILSAATAEQMHDSPLTLLPPLNRMELGFFETNINGREVIAHLGDTQDFHTSLHLFLRENVGFYVSFNSLGKDGAAGGLRGALFEDFADRYFPQQPQTGSVDARGAARHAAMLRFSVDELSPFMVFYRPPWYSDGRWLRPLFYASLAALALTALLWPVAAIVRRRYGAALSLEPLALRVYRLSRIGAIALLAGVLVWASTLALMLKDFNNLSARFDPVVWFAELFGIVALLAGLALILWNLRVVWLGRRRWPARLWSVVLVFAAVIVWWVALAFKLIGLGTSY